MRNISAPRGSSRPALLSWGRALSALPNFALAGTFLITWLWPYYFHQKMVAYLGVLMVMEFIIIHSSAFMGAVSTLKMARWKKTGAMFGLGAFYTLFVLAFCAISKASWPLWMFWGLTLNKLAGLWLGKTPTEEEEVRLVKSWSAPGALYILLGFVAVVSPVPELGVTQDVVQAQGIPGGGLFIKPPHHVMAFGVLYFAALGLSTLFGHFWIPVSARTKKPSGGEEAGTS